MKLLTLIAACFLTYLGIGALGATWWLSEVSVSEPVVAQAVKGISTDTGIALAQAAEATPKPLGPYPTLANASKVSAPARQYALYHVESGKVLSASNIEPVAIASTTKLMTALLAAEHLKNDETIEISPYIASVAGSRMGLRSDSTLTTESLLYGLLLVSGNDAANALAETIGGQLLTQPEASSEAKVARFIEEMNAKAAILHLSDTKYADPAGLNDDGRSTAVDLAKLASVVAQHENLRSMMRTADITVWDTDQRQRFDLHNSNRITTDYGLEGSIGGKTGFTPAAGHCLVSSATRDGQTLVAVVLSTYSETPDASAKAARQLLESGFSQLQID